MANFHQIGKFFIKLSNHWLPFPEKFRFKKIICTMVKEFEELEI